MARAERILALDIGASSIKVGEFEYPSGGGIVLTGFDHREYDEELGEGSRSLLVGGILRDILEENTFTAKKVLICISGQSAFTRFVKLPPVADEEHRVKQIIEFEARQNVPFSMEEVIWDYQLIGSQEADELEVMFVVIKNDIVEEITGAVRSAGLDLQLVDVAPVACYNAARANKIGEDDCSMILNIGGRSTNLLFADKKRFFARTIPIAGHTITQQLAREFGIGFEEAEELKRRHGFVALGGAYEEPESEVAAAVSKIIRNVMARLHGEINRSISVYRAQQKGNRPTALFLAGGSSTMAYTDHFFAEKLRMDIKYFNPFQVVSLAPSVNSAALQEKAHMFSEVVGLALRYKIQCPVEISLMPAAIRREKIINQKKPYVAGCLACVLLMFFASLLVTRQKAQMYAKVVDRTAQIIQQFEITHKAIKQEQAETRRIEEEYASMEKLLVRRTFWPDVLNEIMRLKPRDVWLSKLYPKSQVDLSKGAQAQTLSDMGGEMDYLPSEMGLFPGAVGGGRAATGATVDGLELRGESLAVGFIDRLLSETETVDIPQVPPTENVPEGQSQLPPEAGMFPPPLLPAPMPVPVKPGAATGRTVALRAADKALSVGAANPEALFLERLKASKMFAGAEFATYKPSDKIRNLTTFVINIKFKSPYTYE